jgi:drug/metabolite transporter (DMT)-like permease
VLAARHRLQILGAALLFSTGGAAVKASSLTNWQLACFRSGVAALVLLLFMPSWRGFWHPRCLLVGVAYGATMILYVTGNKLTTAANVIFLQATAPVYLLFLGPRLLGERVERRDLFFTAALAIGMALFFVGSEAPQTTAPAPLAGNVVGALAGLSWALTILGLRWLGRQPGPDRTGSAVPSSSISGRSRSDSPTSG